MPVTPDHSDRPHVWWRVPKDWAPGGVLFAREQTPALLRVLARSPRTRDRDALLSHAAKSARVARSAPTRTSTPPPSATWSRRGSPSSRTPPSGASRWGCATTAPAAARPTGASSRCNVSSWGLQRASAVVCHRSSTLKWFRVENVSHAKVEPETRYRPLDDGKGAKAFAAETVGGYRGDGEAIEHAFVVREPEARRVRVNLLAGMTIDPDDATRDGVRVRCVTPGVVRGAGDVGGVGGAARGGTAELARCVRETARDVLAAVEEEAGSERTGKRVRAGARRARG